MGDNNNKIVSIVSNRFTIDYIGHKTKDDSTPAVRQFTVYQYKADFGDKNASLEKKRAELEAYQNGILRDAFLLDGNDLYCSQILPACEVTKEQTKILPKPPEVSPDGEFHGLPKESQVIKNFGNRKIVENGKIFAGLVIKIFVPKSEAVTDQQTKEGDEHKLTLTFIKKVPQEDPIYIQIYDLIIEKCMSSINLILMGKNFCDLSPDVKIDLPNLNVRIQPVYQTSVKSEGSYLLLDVDVSNIVIQNENLLDTINRIKKKYKNSYYDDYIRIITDMLKDHFLIHSLPDTKSYKVSYIDWISTPNSKIWIGDKKSKYSYFDEYKKKYKNRKGYIEITDMKQPIVVDTCNVKLFPELLSLAGNTDGIRNNKYTMKEIQKHIDIDPLKRMNLIYRLVDKLVYDDKVKEILSKWGLSFKSNNMLATEAKVLPKETITFANNSSLQIYQNEDWTKQVIENGLLDPVPFQKWIVITDDESGARGFVYQMRKYLGPKLGVKIKKPLEILSSGKNTRLTLKEYIGPGSAHDQIQFVLVILRENSKFMYKRIKDTLMREFGVISHFVLSGSHHKKPDASEAIIQMNIKLGGIPWKLSSPIEMQQNFMVIGLDYFADLHTYGIIVASINQDLTKYYSRSYTSKKPGSFGKVVEKSIDYYCDTQGTNQPPSYIFLYFNVDKNPKFWTLSSIDFSRIKNNANNLQNELDELYKEKYGSSVKLVFIVVSNPKNTRVWPIKTSNLSKSQETNLEPGTVVNMDTKDTEIEFLMVSSHSSQGAVQPTNYRVIFGDKEVSRDALQMLTYKLCHIDFSCNKIANLPAVCKYAENFANTIENTQTASKANKNIRCTLYYL